MASEVQGNIGSRIIDYIIKAGLIHSDEQEPTVLVWSANAPEQLTQLVEDLCSNDTCDAGASEEFVFGELAKDEKELKDLIKQLAVNYAKCDVHVTHLVNFETQLLGAFPRIYELVIGQSLPKRKGYEDCSVRAQEIHRQGHSGEAADRGASLPGEDSAPC